MSTHAECFERIVRRIAPGARLLRQWELTGGVSARVTALEFARVSGETARLVVRRYGETDLRRNPNLAADELRLLHLVRAAGVAAPEPHFADQSGEIFPTPFIVVEFVDGTPRDTPADAADLVDQLARQLAAIHRIDSARHGHDLAFLRPVEEAVAHTLRPPPASPGDPLETRMRAALAAGPPARHNPPVLLHGDYWPGNALWRDDRLVAIIDWEDAAVGDPLADLANARLELLWALGEEAMRRFTARYLALAASDTTDLPYWDLWAALRPLGRFEAWAADAVARAAMRERHGWFVEEAFGRV